MQPEIFPRELGRKIVKAEEIRHASDYDTFYIASKMITAEQTRAVIIHNQTIPTIELILIVGMVLCMGKEFYVI